MKKTALIGSLLFALPFIAFAQNLQYGVTLLGSIGGLVSSAVPILIGLAMVAFFWGLVKYVKGVGKDHEAGKNVMIAGLVALFVMVSVWGIIQVAQGALGIGTGASFNTPSVPGH